ncbi:hypothetical protein MC7420_6674 [Coleofasciculus chthonoplastes PCC 7420]|uniref:Uncharacterized protein n=1 Tax=Coleofasciculus chthonoplastes PCC 7420 TaxID=118168 RepID=B4VW80_9CYAN|nr:hypothetical protein [Coleofasciculus chthonoplastes]EDX73626.1 hypothetical protein MC7420_6674 [Coleofasciculus chthonoplastes PCC 7420]
MTSYMPRSDADFNNWQANFVTALTNYLSDLGLTAEDITSITTAQTEWTTAYNNHIIAQSAADSARQEKDDSRQTYKTELRRVVNQLQVNPQITDAMRQGLGITVPKSSSSAVGVPTTRPLPRVELKGRYQLEIHFVDETTPTRKAKPSGMIGSEIWVKIGDPPPTDPKELTFVALDTATPYVMEFSGEDVGKTAYFMLRWVNTKGESGPWSQTVSMMIPG